MRSSAASSVWPGTIAFLRRAGAHAARHQHPHAAASMISGRMDDLNGEKPSRAGACGGFPTGTA